MVDSFPWPKRMDVSVASDKLRLYQHAAEGFGSMNGRKHERERKSTCSMMNTCGCDSILPQVSASGKLKERLSIHKTD